MKKKTWRKPFGEMKGFFLKGEEFRLQLRNNGHKARHNNYFKKRMRDIRKGVRY